MSVYESVVIISNIAKCKHYYQRVIITIIELDISRILKRYLYNFDISYVVQQLMMNIFQIPRSSFAVICFFSEAKFKTFANCLHYF